MKTYFVEELESTSSFFNENEVNSWSGFLIL